MNTEQPQSPSPIQPQRKTPFETGVTLLWLSGLFMAIHLIAVVFISRMPERMRSEYMPTDLAGPIILGLLSTLLSMAAIALAIIGVCYVAFDKRPLSQATIQLHNQRKLVWGILAILSPFIAGILYFVLAMGAFVSSQIYIQANPITGPIVDFLSNLATSLFIPGITCGIILLTSRRKVPVHDAAN